MCLCGHWPLLGHAQNVTANRAHGAGNIVYGPDGAVFDGRSARLDIHDVDSHIQGNNFTLAVNVWIDSDSAESIGDIASKYDVQRRTGFNWSVVDHGGVTSASANYRNPNFSMDAGTDPRWIDRGRPGNARHVCALTVHRGDLYAATFEHGEREIGGVFRHAGGTTWENTELPCSVNCVFSLASLDGTLYAVSGRYDPRNSAMPDVGNMTEEMRAWRLDESGRWEDCGVPCAGGNELCMLGIYRGRLYATPSFSRGLFRYDGGKQWAVCKESYPRFLSLCQWRGHLYGASNKGLRELGPPPEREIRFIMLPDADGVYRYDDASDAWAGCGDIPVETQMYAFAVHRGALHTGTWPSSKVYRSTTGIGWDDCGRLHPDEKEVMAMCVYNGMLYAGTLPAADIYRFDGDHRWTKVGNVDSTPNVKYRRAWSMAVHDGGLFVGALPTGHVHQMYTGAVACDSRQLTTGWHHVSAVRDGVTARLYVDGELRGQSSSASLLDLSNGVPLTLGFGAHDYFRGKMRDLRLYNRALQHEEVNQVARLGPSTGVES
jgi:hypothetical protein